MEEEEREVNSLSGIFDVRQFLVKILKLWWLFVLVIGIGLCYAYYKNQFIQTIHYASSLISIKDNSNPLFTSNQSLTFNWGGTTDKVTTAIVQFKSRTHAESVVDELQYYINYIKEGEYYNTDAYKQTPFNIYSDSSKAQIYGKFIRIKVIDQEGFELSANFPNSDSTSAFITVSSIVTLQNKPKFIWHDHYGKANQLHSRPTKLLNYLSRFFDHIISVNSLLKDWAIEKLRTKEVTYLENFAVKSTDSQLASSLIGNQGKRIICLANLREQKDHFNLIHAFEIVYKTYPEWTLHLCGQDFNDVYSSKVKNLISEKNMQNAIFLLGSRSDVSSILEECDIAVLSSKSEGLPVALLEYGFHQLPVITTDVGACAEVVQNYGIVVPLKNAELLATAIKKMIASKELRENYATQFHNHIVENYGSDRYVEKLLEIYNQIH